MTASGEEQSSLWYGGVKTDLGARIELQAIRDLGQAAGFSVTTPHAGTYHETSLVRLAQASLA